MQSSIFCAAAAPLLGNVSIILVAPKEPGNVGSVLRAGANFDVKTVGVVAPRCDPYDSDVYRLACDSPLLDTMQVFPTLKEALTLKISSIGFTRRAGRGRQTHPSLPSLLSTCPGVSQQIFQTNSSSGGDVALVFGREESGLLDVEVGLCTHACAIPSAPTFPSLNLSHAVAVVLSSLYAARATSEEWEESGEQKKLMTMMRDTSPVVDNLASQGEVEALLERVVLLMAGAGMDARENSGGGDKSNHGRKRRPVGHLRALLSRSQASTAEIRALHGVLKEIERSTKSDQLL